MAPSNQKGASRRSDGPVNPGAGGESCDPLPTKKPKPDSKEPPCPEGYPDRQPTKPPAEEPDQRPH